MEVFTDRHKGISEFLKAFIDGKELVHFKVDDPMLAGAFTGDRNCFCGHCENLQRKIQMDSKERQHYVWDHSGPDHWALAGFYKRVAASRMQRAEHIFGAKTPGEDAERDEWQQQKTYKHWMEQ